MRDAVPLGDFLQQIRLATGGALLREGPVPGDEIAVGVAVAAEEGLPPARFPLHDLPAAAGLRALHAHLFELDVAAGRVVAAGGELAEAAVLHHQMLAAGGALLVQDPVGLTSDVSFLVDLDLLGVPAGRVVAAGDERSEASLAQHHGAAALLASLLDLGD